MTMRSIKITGISALGADCIAVTVPPSTAVLITRAEIAAMTRAWVEMVFMIGPLFGFVAMDRTVGSGRATRKRLAMDCVIGAMSCKALFCAESAALQFMPAFRRFIAADCI